MTPALLQTLRTLPLAARRQLAACEGPGWWIQPGARGTAALFASAEARGNIERRWHLGFVWLPASEDAILGVVVALLTERGWTDVRMEIHRDDRHTHICLSGWPSPRHIPKHVRANGPDLRTAALALLVRVAGEVPTP